MISYDDQYLLELFHCALVQRDQHAWEAMQQYFYETMLNWMRHHPNKEAACHIHREEYYVAQAFVRLWQAAEQHQILECRIMEDVLGHLQASLNSVILDTLRANAPQNMILLPELSSSGKMSEEKVNSWLCAIIQSVLSGEREQRVAYLLFYCCLKPKEIVQNWPQEFRDVQEIYRVRRIVLDHLIDQDLPGQSPQGRS